MLSSLLIVAINFNYSWKSHPEFWCVSSHKHSTFFLVYDWWLINRDLSILLFRYNKQPFQVWFEDDDNDDDEDDDYDDGDEDEYDDDDYDDDYDDDDYDDDYDGDDG